MFSIIFFIFVNNCVADNHKWENVAIVSGNGAENWQIRRLLPESYQLLSQNQYSTDGSLNGVLITVISNGKKLNYIFQPDPFYYSAVPVQDMKAKICGSETLALVLRSFVYNSMGDVSLDDPTATFYFYERIFLNLDKSGQIVQVDDDYSSYRAGGDVPLYIFLEKTKHACKDGFISFSDSENN